MKKQASSTKAVRETRKSPLDTAGMILRTSSGQTFGKVTTFSGQRETQLVINNLLSDSKSVPSKLNK